MKTILRGLKTALCVLGLSIGTTANAQDVVVLMNEGFPTAALPTNWTVLQQAGSDGWEFGVTNYTSSFYTIPAHPTGGAFTASNDDACNCDMSLDQLITPVFNLTPFDSVTILFDVFYTGAYGSLGTMEISNDGGATWVYVSLPTATSWQLDLGLTLVNGDELVAGQGPYNFTSDMVFRFIHNDAGDWADGVAIDNVLLAGFFQACDNTLEDGRYPTAAITPNTNGSVTTIATDQYAGSEYSVITGVGAGRVYEFTHGNGAYITVREGASNGPIVLNAGYSPLVVQTTSGSDLYVHWTTDEFCSTSSTGFYLTTVQDISPVCDMSGEEGQYPASAITPNGLAVTTISTLQYLGAEYSVLTGIVGGNYYQLTHSGGAYITVRSGAVAGPVVAQGYSPVQFTAASSADLYVHWTADALCTVANTGLFTTTVQNLGTPPCDMSSADGQWPTSAITPNPNGSVTTISTNSYAGSEYSVITGVLNAHQYQFVHAAGSYITVRQGAVNGNVLGAGFSPLTVTATSTANLYVHWTADASCTIDDSGSHLTTVQDLGVAPCDNSTADGKYPSSNITPNASGAVTNIATNMYAGSEYSVITGVVAGDDYVFTHAFVGSYITVRVGAIAGPVLGAGFSPLTVTANSSADLFVHWTADDVCTINATGSYLATVQRIAAPVCTATAGTLTADASPVTLVGGSAVISATQVTAPVVPTGYSVVYVLTQGPALTIEQVAASPSFTVTAVGDYTIHTLVFDPADQLTLLAATTGFDVDALLIQGGGSLCGALDVSGAPIDVQDEVIGTCDATAGTLTADASPVTLVGGSAVISATQGTAPVVPSGYSVVYVLTQGPALTIEQVAASPSFTVTAQGDYIIHTLVYDPADQATLLAATTGFEVNDLLIQGGGALCGALDVTGAPVVVELPVGINEALNNTMTVYPNPSNGQFIVALDGVEGKATLNIVDMMGRNVYTQSVTVNGTIRQSIDLNVASGSYLLQVITDNGVATRKVELR